MAKGADAFILCSLGEAIAMSLIENMYIKKLILDSNTMGNKSVIKDGVNGYVCDTAEEYGESCVEVLGKLKNAAPDAKIIVSSTLPVTASALEDNPVWNKIPSFSAAMAQACEKTGAVYIDNTELGELYMGTLWDEDGVHLKPEFYPLWAKNLLRGTIS